MAGGTLEPIRSEDQLEYEIYNTFRKYAEVTDPESSRNRKARPGGSRGIVEILNENPCPAEPDPGLIKIAIGFMWVENFLPDYIAQIMSLVRDSAGQLGYLMLWGGQEKLHSWAIAEWLQRVGVLDQYGIVKAYRDTISSRWDPVRHPDTPIDPRTSNSFFANRKYGAAYVTLQEKATSYGYRGLSRLAKRTGQLAFAKICDRLEAEEMLHHVFYRSLSALFMRHCPEEYIWLFHQAYKDFAMPAKYVVGGDNEAYVEWSNAAGIEGVVPVSPRIQAVLDRRDQRSSPIITPAIEARQQARRECWEVSESGIGRIFTELNIPFPKVDL